MEWNSPAGAEHTGVYTSDLKTLGSVPHIRDQGELLRLLSGGNRVFTTLNHPDWQLTPHYRREAMLARQGYSGVEIFNGNIELCEGSALSTNKWDYLLAHGRRLFGLACDDSHSRADIGLGWLMVRSERRSVEGVLAGLCAGNFYCSTGVTIADIRRVGDTLFIETADAQEIQAIGRGGVRLALARGGSAKFDLGDFDTSYVRLTLFGQGSTMAWTQPFFLDRETEA